MIRREPTHRTHAYVPTSSRCVLRHFFFQAEDGIRDLTVTGVQTCALPILFKLLVRLARRPQTRAPQTRTPRRQPNARRGAISVFAAILIVVMLASAAFAIDRKSVV